jgi:hypothetical protein
MAVIASGIVMAPAVHATPSNSIVLVPPTDLPELARQPGDAMFLRDANDGRTVLYVEQNHGAQLAVFDVTDPSHVKSEGSVQLGTPGPFDFVSPLGGQQELVRFRQDQGGAVLDLHKAWLPSLKPPPGIGSQGPISLLGDDGFTVSGQAATGPKASNPQPMQDYRVIDTSSSRSPAPVFEVKQVREELTKQDTGTTFLLTEAGLYLIRRPTAESDKRRREEDWFWQHTGG